MQNQNAYEKENISEKLCYTSPAEDWFSALPLGNGRLGAMMFGTVEEEHIQMNEESLWAGCPEDPYPRNVKARYLKFQKLSLQGKYTEALDYAMDYLAISPTSFRSYTPLDGDKMEAAIRYEREKDIKQYVDANKVLCIDGQLFDDPEGYDDNKGGSGKSGYHMKFASKVSVKLKDGELVVNDNQLLIKDAGEFTVIVSTATDYNPEMMDFDRNVDAGLKAYSILDKTLSEPSGKIKKDHIKTHSEVYNRVDFCISDIELDDIPTNERIERLKESKDAQDNYLTQVFFQYGRYLLMGSSAGQAALPANLQGIWNKDIWAPWEADYHLDINLQMNYWPADVCNLSVVFDPLSDYVYRLSEKGKTTATKFIGSEGWITHICSNIFGRTTPSGSNKSSQVNNGYCFPLAGAWMSLSLWRHYPVIQVASQFILDFLVENHKGEFVTVPSYSPENAYIDPFTGQSIRNTVSATMDIQIINEIFQACLEAEKVLGKPELTHTIQKTLPKLPKVKIGADGTIQELYEDYEEVNPAHRHISHLFGLHPAGQITPSTPDLYHAALKTLEKRLSSGGGQTGWSRAWVVNFYARFYDGDACNKHINALITNLAAPNLFDLHPPHIFQIDGNLGATAGIAEMLIQSHEENTIRLLAALPDAWNEGPVKGLKARGDYVVDMTWKDGELQSVKITSNRGGKPNLVYKDKNIKPELRACEEFEIDAHKL